MRETSMEAGSGGWLDSTAEDPPPVPHVESSTALNIVVIVTYAVLVMGFVLIGVRNRVRMNYSTGIIIATEIFIGLD